MFSSHQYALLDFGEGRKLEKFGEQIVDRPALAAEGLPRNNPSLWKQATARYQRESNAAGKWILLAGSQAPWPVQHGKCTFELRLAPSGQVGLFPEQAENWGWLANQVESAGRSLKLLNLFAYTGGSTLAAAAAGAEVVHVDAAASVVQWARTSAQLSRLAAAPIRWITEDARRFVQRELKRGAVYDGVILDPPSYGHGPRGKSWKIESDLPDLLAGCSRLMSGRPPLWLFTCHTAGWRPEMLVELLNQAQEPGDAKADSRELFLKDSAGRKLPAGMVCRVSAY